MSINWLRLAEQERDRFVETLNAFLSIDSVEDMTTAREGRPFGNGVGAALEYFLQLAERDGFTPRNLEGYAGIVDHGNGHDTIGVLAHVDVVPPGDGWTTPPFEPNIRDGKIYARGAIDDKGPALAAYFAMKLVRDAGVPLNRKIRYILGTDEESGWLCMKRYGELETFPEVGFSPDATFPIINAEKGQITVALRPQTESPSSSLTGAQLQLTSFESGLRVNMVPDSATAVVAVNAVASASADSTGSAGVVMADLHSAFERFLADHQVTGSVSPNGDQTVSFTVLGKSAHAMTPHLGVNAGLLLAKFLSTYTFDGSAGAFVRLLADVLYQDTRGENLGIAVTDEMTGPLTVNAGVMAFHDGNDAVVRLNIRYPVSADGEERLGVLADKLASLSWDVVESKVTQTHYVPDNHWSIQVLQHAYQSQTGEEPTLLSTGGATYARVMKHGVAFGAGFPNQRLPMHEVDEYAEIDDLIRAMAIYAQAIYELANGDET